MRLAYEIHGKIQTDNFTLADIMSAVAHDAASRVSKIEKIREDEINPYEEEPGLPEKRTGEKSFFEKMSLYLKGRNLIDILEDMNHGAFMNKIHEYGKAPLTEIKEDEPAYAEGQAVKNLPPGERFSESVRYPVKERTYKGTIFLRKPESIQRVLTGMKKQQGVCFEVKEYPFTIGKLEGLSNAVVNVPAISRVHARIYKGKEERDYQIEDLNSTNGTFVNDEKLPPYTKKTLNVGDVIRLADEEFCFR